MEDDAIIIPLKEYQIQLALSSGKVKTMNNVDVRLAAKGAGIPLWQIAAKMGISEPTMSRKLRKPLSEDDKQQILTIIADLQKEGNAG